MEINIVEIILIIVFGSLAYVVNGKINKVPDFKSIVDAVILVVCVLFLIHSLGWGGHVNTSVRV